MHDCKSGEPDRSKGSSKSSCFSSSADTPAGKPAALSPFFFVITTSKHAPRQVRKPTKKKTKHDKQANNQVAGAQQGLNDTNQQRASLG
jgi:hypothetical protein